MKTGGLLFKKGLHLFKKVNTYFKQDGACFLFRGNQIETSYFKSATVDLTKIPSNGIFSELVKH